MDWLYIAPLIIGAIIFAIHKKKKKKKDPEPPKKVITTPTSTNFKPPEIALSDVNWLHTNVYSWPETSNLVVNFPRPGVIRLRFDKTNIWPHKMIRHNSGGHDIAVNANPWVFVYRNGRWHAGTWEWFQPGNFDKNCKNVAGDHIKQAPLADWRPKKGETVYFMVSALARNGSDVNLKERTNIVKVTWPGYYQ